MKKRSNNYIDGRCLKEYCCIDCGKRITIFSGIYGNGRCRSCASKYKTKLRNHKGKNNPFFGKSAPHGKGGYYKNTWMRSSYEIAFAQWLDKNNVKWLYEPKRFNLNDILTYCPDFYLPKTNKYIEIKGWWRGKTKERFNSFKKLYPNVKIELLMKPELQRLGVL